MTDLALLVPAVHSVGHLRKDAHVQATVASLLIVILGVVRNLFGVKAKFMLRILGACIHAALVLQKLPAHVHKVLHDREECTFGSPDSGDSTRRCQSHVSTRAKVTADWSFWDEHRDQCTVSQTPRLVCML